MANNENLIPIPGRLHSVATEGHVSGANEIYDDTLQKDQATINSEVNTALGTGGTVDEKIEAALEDVAFIDDSSSSSAVVPSFDPESQTVHVTAQTLSEQQKAQVRENIGLGDVDAKINQAVASEASQRAAAVSGVQDSVNAETTRAQAAEEQLRQAYEALSQSQPIPVTELPTTGEEGKIYRLAGTTSYADYMYAEGALTTPIKMAEYDNAIDEEPTAGSRNLVESGGVAQSIGYLKNTVASVSGVRYENHINGDFKRGDIINVLLEGNLTSTSNILVRDHANNTLIENPIIGETYEIILQADTSEIYVVTINTTSNVDVTLIVETGVYKKTLDEISKEDKKIDKVEKEVFPSLKWELGFINVDGDESSSENYKKTSFIPVTPQGTYFCNATLSNAYIAFYSYEKKFISSTQTIIDNTITIPDNAYYVRLSNHLLSKSVNDVDFYNMVDRYGGLVSEGDVEQVKEVADNWEWIDNKYINYSTGDENDNNLFKLTGFIPVVPNTEYFCNSPLYGNGGIAYYSSNKVFADGINSITNNTITIPDGVYYVRISCYKQNMTSPVRFYSKNKFTWKEYATQGDITKIQSLQLDWTVGYISTSNGSENTTNGFFKTSNYIPVIPGAIYFCNTGVYGVAGIASYDADKVFKGGLTNTDNTITIPSDVYFIRLSTRTETKIKEAVSLYIINKSFSSQFVTPSDIKAKEESVLVIKNNNKSELQKLPKDAYITNNSGTVVDSASNYGTDNSVLVLPITFDKTIKNSVIRFKVRFNDDLNKKNPNIDYTQSVPRILNFFSMKSGNHRINFGVLPNELINPTYIYPGDYGQNVGIQGTTKVKAVNGSNDTDSSSTGYDGLPCDNYDFKLLAGQQLFSIQWINNTAEYADVCMSNDGEVFKFYHSSDNSVISSYTLANYSSLQKFYNALSEDTNLRVSFYQISYKDLDEYSDSEPYYTTWKVSDLMQFSGIILVSQRSVVDGNNYIGSDYPRKTVYDNPPVMMYANVDRSWHTVEIAANSSINSGVYCCCIDGFHLYATGERISYLLNPTLYFGGDENGAEINCSIKDIEVKFNNPEDTEFISETPSTKVTIISNWHPKVFAFELHGVEDIINNSDLESSTDTAYNFLSTIFSRLIRLGYVPLTNDEFERYVITGEIPYKRAFISIYDDLRYPVYLNRRINNLHKRFGVKCALAEVSDTTTYEYDGVTYNVKDINDDMIRDGWVPFSHTRHQVYPRFGYDDMIVAMANNVSDAKSLHIPVKGLVWPGGAVDIMDMDAAREYGWSYAFGIPIRPAQSLILGNIKPCCNRMKLPRFSLSNNTNDSLKMINIR